MHKSITSRYFYSTAVLLLCSIAVMGFAQMYMFIGYYRNENNDKLLATIDSTIALMKEFGMTDDMDLSDDTSMTLARSILLTSRVSGNSIYLTDPYGCILRASTDDESEYVGRSISQRAMSAAYATGSYTELGTLGWLFSSRNYVAVRPVFSSSGQLTGFVAASIDASNLNEFLANIFSVLVLSAGLMLMVSSVLSILLSARMIMPLRRMAEAAKKFGAGDFTVRVSEDGDEELNQLSKVFNNMAENLEKIDVSRRSFMGNIAHELRTPMTSIKGFVDGMLDGTIPPESRDHYLAIVSQECGRLTRLIKNMLDITKLEAGEYKVNATNYDVWETITAAVFAAEQRIEEKNIQLSGFAPVKTVVFADADLVFQVVANLLDNAIKFCPEEGEIRFSVTQEKGVVTISVRNTGQGISADALPFVFERFYKEDKSRGLNAAGSGLGLHICKVLVNLSGGRIWVESREGEYCQFFFTLPAAQKNTRQNGEKAAR